MKKARNIHTAKFFSSLCGRFSILFIALFTLSVSAFVIHADALAREGAKVSIVNFAFAPPEIIIAPGESVTWTNADGAPHGLNYHDGVPGTDLLLPGENFSRRFDQPGIYDYNCSIHPYMTGRVVVRAR